MKKRQPKQVSCWAPVGDDGEIATYPIPSAVLLPSKKAMLKAAHLLPGSKAERNWKRAVWVTITPTKGGKP